MKFIFLSIFLFSTATCFSQLHVSVENLKKDSGTVLIAIYNSKKSFNNIREVFLAGRVKAKDLKADFTFNDIPAGEYAISLFHDVNDNEKLDKTSVGIPSEPYGFSNNAKGSLGPPSFKKAKFTYDGNSLDVAIKLY